MLKVGQVLWYVPARRGEPREVVVTKVGRKWATIGEGWQAERIDLVDLWVDGKGYSSPGKCYLSREIYEQEVERQGLWRSLVQNIAHKSCPQDITSADILAIMDILKLERQP